MRARMTRGTGSPGDVRSLIAECFHRGGGGGFMAVVAGDVRVRTVQWDLGDMREGLEVVEGMLLAVAFLTGTLHGTFMRVVVALDAILREGGEARSALFQDLGVGIGVAIDAGQAVVAAVEMEIHALVLEFLDLRQVGLREAEFDQGTAHAIEVLRVTEPALRRFRYAQAPVDPDLRGDLIGDGSVTLHAGAGQILVLCSMALHASFRSLQPDDARVGRDQWPRARVANVEEGNQGDDADRDEACEYGQALVHPWTPRSAYW